VSGPKSNDFGMQDSIEEIFFRGKGDTRKDESSPHRWKAYSERPTPWCGRDPVKEQWDGACLFRAEGDIRQNSPSVQL